MSVTKWVIGLKSAFDVDSDGVPINSIINSVDTYTFTYNPETEEINYTNLGNQVLLLNGAPRIIKKANSTKKREISISQRLLTTTEFDSLITFLDRDEDLVLVDDDGEVIVVKITNLSVSRKKSTARRLVSYTYNMSFVEI